MVVTDWCVWGLDYPIVGGLYGFDRLICGRIALLVRCVKVIVD